MKTLNVQEVEQVSGGLAVVVLAYKGAKIAAGWAARNKLAAATGAAAVTGVGVGLTE